MENRCEIFIGVVSGGFVLVILLRWQEGRIRRMMATSFLGVVVA